MNIWLGGSGRGIEQPSEFIQTLSKRLIGARIWHNRGVAEAR